MQQKFELNVNGKIRYVEVDPETPLLYVLRNDLDLKGPKFGCGLEQCHACKVLVDGNDVPSCKLPVKQVVGLSITTIEGLGTKDNLHPLQESFIEEQAIQCGYCASGMIIAAQGLLNRTRYPTDDDIRTALSDNICRCGVYERVRRAIKMRIGQPVWDPIYEVIEADGKTLTDRGKKSSELPGSLQNNPELDAWIRINTDGTITVFTGKVEIGQGIKTAVSQIAAEELDVSLARIRVVTADTGQTPDEGVTAGSMSLQMSGNAIRQAAAEARHILLTLAFEELESETPAASLPVDDGTITDPLSGRTITYWALLGGQRFNHQVIGVGSPKSAQIHQIVGGAAPRLDLPDKVTGAACFVHDMDLPGMLYGRIVRPPAYDARLVAVDETAVSQQPGVIKVVRDGSFLGVITQREEQAIWAREALQEAAVWENNTKLPAADALYDHLLSQPAQDTLVVDGTATTTALSAGVSDPIPPIKTSENAAHTLNATYHRPYQMHASLSPSAAVAQMVAGKLTVWSHSQGVYLLQHTIAQVLEMDSADVRVIHAEAAGCFGHNGADDAALDAALLARAVPGQPVSLKWMRSDEHAWEPYGSAMIMSLQASLNREGRIVDWNHDVWSYPHSTRARPGSEEASGLLASWHLKRPFSRPLSRPIAGYHFGDYRNADPLYALPNKRIVTHLVPNSPLRISALRSLGAYANLFAIESFIDELAFAAGVDPIEFRLRHLTDERARAVINAAAAKAGWQPKTEPARNGNGRGIAFAQYKNIQCYAAVIVDLVVDLESGEIQMQRAVIAADAGQIVNPDGLSNQLEGGFVQAASWTLHEQVAFNQNGIVSQDWDSYPILRFSGVPHIDVVLIDRPNHPFLGSGEATQGPTPAAIANALFDATGVRFRDLPLTAEKVADGIR